MPAIRFAWNPLLVDLRREVCPGARWQKQGRCWIMNDAEAQRFVRAAQARLDFRRSQAQLRIGMPDSDRTEPFYLIVADHDRGVFSVVGPMTDDRPWESAARYARPRS
jgi:hypothetical protein